MLTQAEQNKVMTKFYIDEDRRGTVKDNFKFLTNIMDLSGIMDKVTSVCDIGCATGDLLWYLRDYYHNTGGVKWYGMDIEQELLNVAHERMSDIEFIKHDIWSDKIVAKFDLITFFGVLGWFDDYERVIEKLLGMLNPNGVVYIFSVFNKYGYTVKYDYNCIDSDGKSRHNIEYVYSIEEFTHFLQKKGLQFTFHEFAIQAVINKKEARYPVRAWTEELSDGSRIIVDQIGRKQDQFLLEICNKSE